MEHLMPLFVLAMFASILAILITAYRKSKKTLSEELGVVAQYQEQCGGRFNVLNWTFPFVRVSVYDHFTVIVCWNDQIVLRKGDVARIEEKGLISKGLHIVHHRGDIPQKIIVWTRNPSKLKKYLENSLF